MGDCSARERLEALIAAHGDEVYRFCLGMLRDHHDAQDACQDAFLRAYRSLDRFREESSLRTWVMRIALNVCRDQKRSAWFKRIILKDAPEGDAQSWIHGQAARDIWYMVDTLPKRQREVVLLYYQQGFTCDEVGKMLRMPKGSVSSNLKRARQRLAQMLGGETYAQEK